MKYAKSPKIDATSNRTYKKFMILSEVKKSPKQVKKSPKQKPYDTFFNLTNFKNIN